nr:hypothetical protein BgiMline_031061 [Biomphalaria glabrata]
MQHELKACNINYRHAIQQQIKEFCNIRCMHATQRKASGMQDEFQACHITSRSATSPPGLQHQFLVCNICPPRLGWLKRCERGRGNLGIVT